MLKLTPTAFFAGAHNKTNFFCTPSKNQWVPNLPHRTPCDLANLKRLYPPCGVTNLQLVNLLHRADYVPLSAKYINCKGMGTSSENFGHANLYRLFKHLKHITIALNAFSMGTKKLPWYLSQKVFFYAIHNHVRNLSSSHGVPGVPVSLYYIISGWFLNKIDVLITIFKGYCRYKNNIVPTPIWYLIRNNF